MHVEFHGVHSWQNGTRCRDGVKLLWCHSWLVFEGSIPTCACFHSEKLFVTCSCWVFFYVLFFGNGKREERWEGRPRRRCVVCKVRKYRALLFTKNKESS